MNARPVALLCLAAVVFACAEEPQTVTFDDPVGSSTIPAIIPSTAGATAPATTAKDDPGAVDVVVDASASGTPISPLILGISGDLDAEEMRDLGITLDSWGGNPSTRFNYLIGHAWNTAKDYEYRNTDYDQTGDAARSFVRLNMDAGAETRLAVPTLGWIAKNDDLETCSFPDGEGGCTADRGASCENPSPRADPNTTSIESTPEMVAAWIEGMLSDGLDIRFIAMDNEPELWGHTHYDVHPECTTYEEILEKYLTYAETIRAIAPDAELMGPVTCCWYDYWHIAPGPSDGSGEHFLTWFLRNVRQHDESSGMRSLDVVDVHFYPQTDVYNTKTDEETNARRLRSTRALWDPTYVDESWIDEPIVFIPRMRQTIEASYPGTPLAISEWNFGADTTMNGALAIAEVLGIYGREGVYAAAYWRSPPVGSPGYYAFKMHGNYDGRGSRFGGNVLPVENEAPNELGAFAALDQSSGILRLLLINKDPDRDITAALTVNGFEPAATVHRWTYGPDDLDAISADALPLADRLTVPASSIVVLEFGRAS